MTQGMQLSIKPCGAPGRQCVAVFQSASTQSPYRGAFLLCRPLAQEAIRTAAMYRVLSERLARQGCDVLRLDYHGSGDSPGEEQDQSLSDWATDILAAHEVLQAEAHGPIRWFGMGLGANLALRASIRAAQAPSHVVLWEPILNGPAYIEALFEGHRAELAREFGYPWATLRQQGRVSEPTAPGDVLGFALGASLTADIAKIQDLPLAPPLRRGIALSCAVHEEQRQALPPISSEHLHLHTVENRTNWMSSQALGSAIVPPDALRIMLNTLD
jgi:alpha-beta hydrolase superfamily lysophospholipase